MYVRLWYHPQKAEEVIGEKKSNFTGGWLFRKKRRFVGEKRNFTGGWLAVKKELWGDSSPVFSASGRTSVVGRGRY